MRFAIFLIAGAALAQKPDVSVKPSEARDKTSNWSSRYGRLDMHNVTLKTAIATAYDVSERDVYGPPSIETNRFDIEIKAGEIVPSAELMQMLREVLADRFRLTAHAENRLKPGYALVIAEGGLKLKEVNSSDGPRTNASYGRLVAERASPARIAAVLSNLFEVPIMDSTGAKGAYDLTLEWSSVERLSADADAPSLFRALAATAGLKLERRSVPVSSIVVDRVE
jgi:uncharacterized protein (TIGR03435 family)